MTHSETEEHKEAVRKAISAVVDSMGDGKGTVEDIMCIAESITTGLVGYCVGSIESHDGKMNRKRLYDTIFDLTELLVEGVRERLAEHPEFKDRI